MDKRFNKFESELASVKKRADLTYQEVLSIREDMTMSKEKENKMNKYHNILQHTNPHIPQIYILRNMWIYFFNTAYQLTNSTP